MISNVSMLKMTPASEVFSLLVFRILKGVFYYENQLLTRESKMVRIVELMTFF